MAIVDIIHEDGREEQGAYFGSLDDLFAMIREKERNYQELTIKGIEDKVERVKLISKPYLKYSFTFPEGRIDELKMNLKIDTI